MADVRYVVMSDLHFGAANSVLTSLSEGAAGSSADQAELAAAPGFRTDPTTVSPMLAGLLDGLKAVIGTQDRRPTLILAGDVLDLALSPDEVSATVFSGFANLAFGEGGVFDPLVYYLPGNHDHHLWETAREAQYAQYITSLPPSDPLIPPWHITRIRPGDESPPISSALLTSLVRRQPGCGDVEVRVVYPNLALPSDDGHRVVVVSHGHFTESIYTLMSRIRDILYPAQRPAVSTDLAEWEEENFAWIDFLWSTLGRSGQVGTDLGLVYADMTSPEDLDRLASNLARGLLARGKGAPWLRRGEQWALDVVFRREANHLARSERGTTDVALSDKGRIGLQSYLEGPLARQLREELGGVPDEVTFVFGHTHKPFVERSVFSGFAAPVRVVNTGGWVVDTATPALTQGGVAVLIDDELETVSLQFYRQSLDATPVPVQLVPEPGGLAPSSFRSQVAGRIDPGAAPWAELSVSAARLVDQRHRLHQAVVAERDQS